MSSESSFYFLGDRLFRKVTMLSKDIVDFVTLLTDTPAWLTKSLGEIVEAVGAVNAVTVLAVLEVYLLPPGWCSLTLHPFCA